MPGTTSAERACRSEIKGRKVEVIYELVIHRVLRRNGQIYSICDWIEPLDEVTYLRFHISQIGRDHVRRYVRFIVKNVSPKYSWPE